MRNSSAPRSRIRQIGVTLIELMIAIVVALLLLAGLIQIYLSSKQSYNATEQLSRMQESGRFAVDLISTDLRRAGFWGGNASLARIGGFPGPMDPPSHVCDDRPESDWGRMVTWRVSGVNHDPANSGYASCAPDRLDGTDILVARYASFAELPDSSPLNPTGLYLRSTIFAGRIITGSTANITVYPANRIDPDNPDSTFSHLLPVVRPIVSHAFYVGDSGQRCPGGQVIPALRRIGLAADGRPVAETVAVGVEQLQVQYLLDGLYRNASEIADTDWRDVRAVRIWVLVRGECPEMGLNNDLTYRMGDWEETFSDNYRRQMYVTTVMLRNSVVR